MTKRVAESQLLSTNIKKIKKDDIYGNYNTIHKIIVNDVTYYAHVHVLEKCDYFKAILKGNFSDKEIKLDFDCQFINFNIIIGILYGDNKYYNWLNDCPFIVFIDILCILDYLQTDKIIMERCAQKFKLNSTKCTINNILDSNIQNEYKRILLNTFINNSNKINLGIKIEDNGPGFEFGEYNKVYVINNKIEFNNIKLFLEQYTIKDIKYQLNCVMADAPPNGFIFSGTRDYKLYINDILIFDDKAYRALNLFNQLKNYTISRLLEEPLGIANTSNIFFL